MAIVSRKLQLAFASAILILIGMCVICYREMAATSESDQWVLHTHVVLNNIQDLRFDMQGAESSCRGYVLTGQDSYLDLYRANLSRIEGDQATFGDLTVDNPVQQLQMPILNALIVAKRQHMDQCIRLRQDHGLPAAAAFIQNGNGRQMMDEFQAEGDRLQDEEMRLLVLRDKAARDHLIKTRMALVAGCVLGLLIAAAAGWSARRDSSARKLAEYEWGLDQGAREESDARYRGLMEAAPDAMVVVNQSGEIVLLNAQAEKQFGYHRDELLGQKVTNIIPEGFAERLIADDLRSIADALAQQIGTGIELNALRKDGSEFPIEIMLSPLENADGILVTAAIRDITARRESEAKYRGLMEAAPDAMVVVDQSGEIVLVNAQAENQFGYHRDELLGQKMTNIIPEGFAERIIADALRSAEDALTQQIGTGIELNGLRKDGSGFPIEIMLSPLKNANGILVTAAIRNITVRKKAEAHLIGKVEELNRSNEELEQFAYIASHDLQEPLRMVASYTQLLARRYKGKLDADADEFINFAVDGANRMQRLIQDLLMYSRVGTKGKEMQETSSEAALEQALSNLTAAIATSGAVITHDPLPSVCADEMQLTQLFQNLVGNAIKYQKPGIPRIHVSAVKNAWRKWMFSVKDNGLGIEPQYFERIFGMFQRLHKREEFEGTGIGLAICKKIVERHGGNISIESQPGEGSTFHFALMEGKKHL